MGIEGKGEKREGGEDSRGEVAMTCENCTL